MKLNTILKPALAIAVGVFASCTGSKEDAAAKIWQSEGKVKVAVTTTMITDMATIIGGDKVEVKGLMDHNVDPHGHDQTYEDSLALNSADVIFYSGLHLEAKMQKGLEQKAKKGGKVYAVTSAVSKSDLLQADGEDDPHVWGNPKIWVKTIDVVLKGLVDADQANKAYYTKRAEDYKTELLELDKWATKRMAEIPANQRVLITSHDAFQYFAQSYGLEVKALQGISTADEAGVNKIKTLTQFIKSRGIKTIFGESLANDKAIQGVAKDAGITVNDSTLFADACGAKEIKEVNGEKYDVSTYTGMIKHNVNTIVDALK